MIWPFRRREMPGPLRAIVGLDGGYEPIQVSLTNPEIRHVVTHEPYPKPNYGTVQVMSNDGQAIWFGQIQCRGGSESYVEFSIQRAYPELDLPLSLPPLQLRFRWDYS